MQPGHHLVDGGQLSRRPGQSRGSLGAGLALRPGFAALALRPGLAGGAARPMWSGLSAVTLGTGLARQTGTPTRLLRPQPRRCCLATSPPLAFLQEHLSTLL